MEKEEFINHLTPSSLAISDEWKIASIDHELLFNFEPLPVVAYITPELRLPPLPVQLDLDGSNRLIEIIYNSWIEYKEYGRNEKSPIIQGKSRSLSFSIDYGNFVMGGIVWLKVVATVRYPNGHFGILQNTFYSNIRGKNPTKEIIRDRLNNIELQVTAYRESRFRQFDQEGKPLFGAPNGFGIMQIDNPPATITQIWNWQLNIDAGKALWAQKTKDAETYPSRVRTQYPSATDFTPDELKLETYQRYNGGAYWKWDDQAKKWVKSPPNNYAEESIRIESLILSGNIPNDWNTIDMNNWV
jgi:hypothetical protein